jgi:hypothetical protein
VAERLGLALAELAQRNVDVAHLEVDHRQAGGVGGVAGDVAGALAVPDDPQFGGPSLSHRRNEKRERLQVPKAGLLSSAVAGDRRRP